MLKNVQYNVLLCISNAFDTQRNHDDRPKTNQLTLFARDVDITNYSNNQGFFRKVLKSSNVVLALQPEKNNQLAIRNIYQGGMGRTFLGYIT